MEKYFNKQILTATGNGCNSWMIMKNILLTNYIHGSLKLIEHSDLGRKRDHLTVLKEKINIVNYVTVKLTFSQVKIKLNKQMIL